MVCVFPRPFKKPFERIIVQTTLLEQKGPITLSFCFEEAVYVGVLLLSQLFKQIAIVDAPPLSITMINAIVDWLFKLIGERIDTTEEMTLASKSNNLQSLCASEKTSMTKKSLLRFRQSLSQL